MKKLLFILLLLPLFVSGQTIENNRIVFREEFRDEFSVRFNGGEPTDVTFSNGAGVFNGSSSKIEYSQTLYNVQSVQINLTLNSITEDILKLSSSHSIEVGSGTVTATGFTSPTIYVDGTATATITTGEHQIIVTTGTAFNADDVIYGTVSGFLDGSIDLSNIYNSVLSAEEVSNLYNNRRFRDIGQANEILNVSAQNGSIIDRQGNTLINTAVTVFKHGDAIVMLFDGADSKINCSDPDDLTGDITAIAWIKPYGFGEGSGGRGAIIYNGQFWFSILGTNTWLFNRSGAESTRGTSVLTLNEWIMVVVTSPSAGTGTVIYANGAEQVSSFDATTPVAGTVNIHIGNTDVDNRTFDGLISDVRIISGILTAAEISQLYTSEKYIYAK